MSLIKLFNSYFINDISNLIYDYYFDDTKILELRKDVIKELNKRNPKELTGYDTLYCLDMRHERYFRRQKFNRIWSLELANTLN